MKNKQKLSNKDSKFKSKLVWPDSVNFPVAIHIEKYGQLQRPSLSFREEEKGEMVKVTPSEIFESVKVFYASDETIPPDFGCMVYKKNGVFIPATLIHISHDSEIPKDLKTLFDESFLEFELGLDELDVAGPGCPALIIKPSFYFYI